ncbi:MAG: aminotransferase class I/II-fold pyridoxal phosphate-dependent enzyme, partial [Chloroflexota bacterium]
MSSPDLTSAEQDAVAAVLRTPDLSMGPQHKLFEHSIAKYAGRKHAIAVNSGTAGLHLCVRAMGITSGDMIITTPFSFVASSNTILYEGGIPVFVDVDALTGNIDVSQVQNAVNDINAGKTEKWLPRKGVENAGKLKVIMPVDVFGQPVDIDPIHAIAKSNDLKTIEDSCEAIGAIYKDI